MESFKEVVVFLVSHAAILLLLMALPLLGGEMLMCVCPKCHNNDVIKNGSAAGKPKKQCKRCGYQFIRTTPRGKPMRTKISAVLWYRSGISMKRIGTLLRVSAQSVLNWIRLLRESI